VDFGAGATSFGCAVSIYFFSLLCATGVFVVVVSFALVLYSFRLIFFFCGPPLNGVLDALAILAGFDASSSITFPFPSDQPPTATSNESSP
jgi:hypothetical protein